MARLLSAQRRLFLFLTAVVFTFVIRLISLSLGSSLREGRSPVIISDRGDFKQVAFRISKVQSKRRLIFPFKLGFYGEGSSTSYMVRIANFFPFVMLENLGIYASPNAVAPVLNINLLLGQDCGGDGGGGGDGTGDGYGDSSDGYC